MKPSSWSVCGSNFTKSLNAEERSTQKTGGRGPTLEVHSPNQEHTATCKTALRCQARSEPTLFESLSYQEGRDEHQNCQCEVAENHWLECSQPHQVLQHSAESSRNHLLASQISPQIYNPALSLRSRTQLHK